MEGLPEGVFDIRAEGVIVMTLVDVFETLIVVDCVGDPVLLLEDDVEAVIVLEELNVFVVVVEAVQVSVNAELIVMSGDELGVLDSIADSVIISVGKMERVQYGVCVTFLDMTDVIERCEVRVDVFDDVAESVGIKATSTRFLTEY